ncbi:hypothetical protein D3C71_1205090 [compost metagenome]
MFQQPRHQFRNRLAVEAVDRRGADRRAGVQQSLGCGVSVLHQGDVHRLRAAAQGKVKAHPLRHELAHQRGIIVGQRMLQGQAGKPRRIGQRPGRQGAAPVHQRAPVERGQLIRQRLRHAVIRHAFVQVFQHAHAGAILVRLRIRLQAQRGKRAVQIRSDGRDAVLLQGMRPTRQALLPCDDAARAGARFHRQIDAVAVFKAADRQVAQLSVPGFAVLGGGLFGALLLVFYPAVQVTIVIAAVVEQLGPAQGLFVAVHPRAQVVRQFSARGQAPQVQQGLRQRALACGFDLRDARIGQGRLHADQHSVREHCNALLAQGLQFIGRKNVAHVESSGMGLLRFY